MIMMMIVMKMLMIILGMIIGKVCPHDDGNVEDKDDDVYEDD